MEVLVYLAKRAGEVVSVDELIDAVWDGRVVGDGAVYQAINQLRHALGDHQDDVRFIQTIPKRGYRLVAPVTTLEPAPNKYVAEGARGPLRGRMFGIAIAALLILAIVVVVQNVPDGPTSPSVEDRRSIAVLPFANQSAAEENVEFFADGIHGDLLTQLAKISSLKVISRTSVMEYRDTQKNMREIGRELGVGTILEGGVQRAGDMVRINVQLIDTETDEQLWAETYDRALTAENIFAIQSEMAISIAEALQATLSPQVVARLSEVPTQNLLAYNFYLNGNDYMRGTDNLTAFSLAAQQYQRAVDEDPEFALAWAGLSRAHSGVYFFRVDPTESRRALARDAVERAFQLAPDLPEAHLAMGFYHYHGYLDYERALQEVAIAEAGMPGDPQIFLARAFIYRRMGQIEQSVASMDRALELDPRNIEQLLTQAGSYTRLRDYDGAQLYVERAREFAPDSADAFVGEAMLPLYRDGDVTLYRALAENPPVDLGLFRHRAGWTAAIFDRDYKQALRYLDDWQVEVDVGGPGTGRVYVPIASYYGTTYRLAGQPELAMDHFEAARVYLEGVLERDPGDPFAHLALAEAMVGLGENESAIRMAYQAMELLPRDREATLGPILQLEAAGRVFVPVGEYDAAIENLEDYLANPGAWSIEALLPDPRLDPIRDDPRFEALVAKYRRQ